MGGGGAGFVARRCDPLIWCEFVPHFFGGLFGGWVDECVCLVGWRCAGCVRVRGDLRGS